MNKKLLVYLVAIVLAGQLVGVAVYYARASQKAIEKERKEAMDKAAAEEQQKTPVKTVKVFTQPLTDRLTLPGTVEPYVDIDLASRRAGTIEWIGPKEGDRVKKGDQVLKIDVEALEARVKELRTAYELAEVKYKRQQELYEKNVLPIEQLDNAEAAVKQTRAALEAMEVDLRNGTLVSPIDGVLDRLPVDTGEHVGEGKMVMKIVEIDRVKVLLHVPEKDILYFKAGEPVEIRFSNGEIHTFKGSIEYVAVTAEQATRTYPVKVVIDNTEGLLRPGMIVRAMVDRRHLDQAVAVPFFTVVDRKGQKVVFVVEEDVARERPVATGFFQGGQIEITKGLDEGDQLVVVGQRNLIDGQEVSVVADLTDMAREFIEGGADPSTLPLELLR